MDDVQVSQLAAPIGGCSTRDPQRVLDRRHVPTRLDDIEEEEELSVYTGSLPQRDLPSLEGLEDDNGKQARRVDSRARGKYEDLMVAIREGDIAFVKSHLEFTIQSAGQSLDPGDNPLILAILEDQVNIAEMILQRLDVYLRPGGLPLLVHAAMSPKFGPRLLQRLFDMGAPANAVSGREQKNVLHWAASGNKSAAVELLLSKGMDIEAKCSKGRTPLALAAEAGHLNVVKVLCAHGANLESRTHNGTTPLMWAAGRGHVSVVEYLLKQGALVDLADKNHHTALFLASNYGHDEVVRVLLDAGADINSRCTKPKGCTPAMAAACTNSVDVLRTLIFHGADLSLRSDYGDTALDVALIERHRDAAKVLLEAMGSNRCSKDSVSLELALANNHSTVKTVMTTASIMYDYMAYGTMDIHAWVSWVLTQGGDTLKQPAMTKMLHAAMQERNLPLIGYLLENGCDVDVHLQSGHTCLSYAVCYREIELISLLLDAGANPNQATLALENGNHTPFDFAILQLKDGRDTEVVDLLLRTGRCRINKGKDVNSTAISYVLSKAKEWAPGVADSLAIRLIDTVTNAEEDRDDTGSTLLHVAVEHEREDFVDLLLGRGVDIDVEADKGFTPFLRACQRSKKMAKALIKRGANLYSRYNCDAGALHAAASTGNVEVLELLLDCGMDIESQSGLGHTPLACALLFGHERTALYLLRCGASVAWSITDKKLTPLHYAARHGMATAVEEIVTMGVDVNALSIDGWSPLHEACATGRSPTIVEVLVEAGADMELPLSNSDRPLHVALINEDEPCALKLIDYGADICARASRNRSLLHIAADYNLPRVAREVLARDPTQMEHVDDSSWTPLCLPYHIEIVEMLLKCGADANYADRDGWTPLHQAVYNNVEDAAVALVHSGATLHARTTDDGLSVLERAVDMARWEVHGRQRNTFGAATLIWAEQRRRSEEKKTFEQWRIAQELKVAEEAERNRRAREEDNALAQMKKDDELNGLDGQFELVDLEEFNGA